MSGKVCVLFMSSSKLIEINNVLTSGSKEPPNFASLPTYGFVAQSLLVLTQYLWVPSVQSVGTLISQDCNAKEDFD